MIELTTQCPQCQTLFEVTLAQLQQRKGLLRCAQCAHIFDAYECAVANSSTTATAGEAAPALAADEAHFIGGQPVQQPDNQPVAFRVRSASTDTLPQSAIYSSQPIHSPNEQTTDDIRVYLNQRAEPTVGHTDELAVHLEPAVQPAASPLPTTMPVNATATTKGRFIWGLGSLILLVLLGAQLLYVYRAPIANSVHIMRPVLQLMCDGLGCTIPYMREIEAIAIQKSSLQQQPRQNNQGDYEYVLQLQLKNNLNWAQEWPTLVLSFSDAAAATLATLALRPEQYLVPSQRQRPFAAGQSYQLRVPVAIAGKKINGFNVEKYYP